MAGKRFKPSKADRLLDPKRREMIAPEQVIDVLQCKATDEVADFGAGNGYFTLPLSERVQRVYAVDIEKQMLDLLQKRALENNVGDNIEYVVSNLEEIRLPDRSVDSGVAAFVLHEVPNLKQAFQQFKRIIKPGQILLALEWEAIDMDMGPPVHERISSDEMMRIFEENGLEPELHSFHDSIYGVSARI